MQFNRKVLHVLNPYLHAHLLSGGLVELRDSKRDCHIAQYDIDLWQIDFQLSNSVEQLGNLYDIALSTL